MGDCLISATNRSRKPKTDDDPGDDRHEGRSEDEEEKKKMQKKKIVGGMSLTTLGYILGPRIQALENRTTSKETCFQCAHSWRHFFFGPESQLFLFLLLIQLLVGIIFRTSCGSMSRASHWGKFCCHSTPSYAFYSKNILPYFASSMYDSTCFPNLQTSKNIQNKFL